MPSPSTFRSGDGTSLACWHEGSGPPLLLVHGGLCDHLAWHFVEPILAQRFTVWTFDRRGHGLSEDTQPHRVEREAEDIAALLGIIGEPACLLGHSAGAIVALRAAPRVRHLKSIVLYEPPFIVDGARNPPAPEVLAEMQRLLASGRPDDALRIAMRETVNLTDQEIDAMRASPGWEHLREAARAIPNDWRIWDEPFDPLAIGQITVPALVIAGSDSPAWIRCAAEAVYRALPSGRLVELEGQGHSAMITSPSLFAEAVAAFLTPSDCSTRDVGQVLAP